MAEEQDRVGRSRPASGPEERAEAGWSKDEWRRWARAQRAAQQLDHGAHCRQLAEFLKLRPGSPGRRWVVAYRALPGEVVLDSLLSRHELGPYALTRTPEHGFQLTVHPLDAPSERHRYGFVQPVATAPTVADEEIRVVLVPGLVFDRAGRRLGWGAGYFDRFLGRLEPAVVRVGITGGLLVDRLPAERHDIAMTHLATAEGVVPVVSCR